MKFSISKSFHVTLVLCSLADCGVRIVLPGFPDIFFSLLVYENPVETLGIGVEDATEKLTCKNYYKINTIACHVGFLGLCLGCSTMEPFTTKIDKTETKLSLQINLQVVSTYRHPEKKSFLIYKVRKTPLRTFLMLSLWFRF